jgi:hypothetical protein
MPHDRIVVSPLILSLSKDAREHNRPAPLTLSLSKDADEEIVHAP